MDSWQSEQLGPLESLMQSAAGKGGALQRLKSCAQSCLWAGVTGAGASCVVGEGAASALAPSDAIRRLLLQAGGCRP
jgi:hypothetical protein